MIRYRIKLAIHLVRLALWIVTPPKGTRYHFHIWPSTKRPQRFILEYLNNLDFNGEEIRQ